jgi:hypothetical protein
VELSNRVSQSSFLPNAAVPAYRQNIGVAAVTPAVFLSEILFSDEL